MARKGWDNLSDAYRKRLEQNGIRKADYDSGTVLHGARGHTSSSRESFYRRSADFAKTVARYDHSVSESTLRQRIRSMGTVEGNRYLSYRQRMIEAYESGDVDEARRLWEGRDQSKSKWVMFESSSGNKLQTDYMYHYHGIFGY
jgi:hypothetical protein